MFRAVRAAAAAVVIAAALSGCSLIPTAGPASPTATSTPTPESSSTAVASGPQSAREACTALIPVVVEINTGMTDAYAALQDSDPQTASTKLHAVSDDLRAALEDVTNEEVLGAGTDFADSLDALITAIDGIIAGDKDPNAMLDASGAVNDDFAAIGAVCRDA